MKRISVSAVLLLIVSAVLHGQASEGTPVNQTAGAPPKPIEAIYDYSGGSNLVYVGIALSDQIASSQVTVSGASNGSPVAFTATAHGFDYQSALTTTPSICISGATGGWTGINGCWVATPTSANAFTIAVDSTTFGAFTGQTITVTTRAPRTTAPVWAIKKYVYDGSSRAIWAGWASNPGGAGATALVPSSTAMNLIWANRATYGYQ
jgi:hypothetical protein